jgi:ribosomal protein S7
MINGKKTRSHTIVYKPFHCLAHHGNMLKVLVNTIKNVTPICEVKKVRIFGTTQLIPSIITTNCQKNLVIRWMFETVTKTTYKQKEHKLKSMLI